MWHNSILHLELEPTQPFKARKCGETGSHQGSNKVWRSNQSLSALPSILRWVRDKWKIQGRPNKNTCRQPPPCAISVKRVNSEFSERKNKSNIMKSKVESSGICALLILNFVLSGMVFYRNQKEIATLKEAVMTLQVAILNIRDQHRPLADPPQYFTTGFTTQD